MVDVESWLSYKNTCHVILLAKLHDMYLYKTTIFQHQPSLFKSLSQRWLSYTGFTLCCFFFFFGESIVLSNAIETFFNVCLLSL